MDHPLLISVDDELPAFEEVKDIQEGNCMNCYGIFTLVPSVFVRLTNGKLIWWHRHQCVTKNYELEIN